MRVVRFTEEIRREVLSLRKSGRSIALVPTMGALHEGHLSLVRAAGAGGDITVVSIFVNPAQFNDKGDLARYPRDLEGDLEKLERVGVDLVFAPQAREIYGDAHQSWVSVCGLAKKFEGASRPGHFRGVTTVVAVLFNLIRPDKAVFGEKDFQQCRIIEQMTRDLHFGVEILRAPTVRETDGLALSSRNSLLSPAGRKVAPEIHHSCKLAREAFLNGQKSGSALRNIMLSYLEGFPEISVDYAVIVDEDTLQECEAVPEKGRILTAAYIDSVRLIDNLTLS